MRSCLRYGHGRERGLDVLDGFDEKADEVQQIGEKEDERERELGAGGGVAEPREDPRHEAPELDRFVIRDVISLKHTLSSSVRRKGRGGDVRFRVHPVGMAYLAVDRRSGTQSLGSQDVAVNDVLDEREIHHVLAVSEAERKGVTSLSLSDAGGRKEETRLDVWRAPDDEPGPAALRHARRGRDHVRVARPEDGVRPHSHCVQVVPVALQDQLKEARCAASLCTMGRSVRTNQVSQSSFLS